MIRPSRSGPSNRFCCMPDETQKSVSPVAAAAGGATAAGGLLAAVVLFKSHLVMFITLLVAILVPVLGVYLFIVQRRKKKRSQMFKDGMDSSSAASPRGISDPNKRAKLDELRRKFVEGVQAYRSRGKDLYSLPWYVIVGEAGGGKSEAIRHSNIGFPPGLQDELQGVGGTINMHWWFSDRAVLLDTAGRMIFEEVPAGESSEWKEFLGLLKNARPNCPINGMILVVPCDSLIKDSEVEVEQKARKLAQQLDLIQRTLDIRFPVTVLITKADLLVGFREFFDEIRDPRLQHQIFGWSNPDKLDAPFRATEVDKFLEEVASRLSQRRLTLLRDPAPENKEGRRADEVDTLYGLPTSLTKLTPRLRKYLETIFAQGAWSLPPLFLRGIYFSSALREGAALDADLATALGVPVDTLGDFKVWERERSFFLRDLFLEKMFREYGLVTRATNTATMLRKRKQLLFGGGSLALIIFVLLAWLGMHSFRNSVEQQQQAWSKVADTNWVEELALIPRGNGGVYEPVTDARDYELRQQRIATNHLAIRQQSTNQLRLDGISRLFFSGLASEYREKSGNAQRIVYEAGVIKPLVDASRQKLGSDIAQTPNSLKLQVAAFADLLKLEDDIQNRWAGTNTGKPDSATVSQFADSLSMYVGGAKLDSSLADTWSWLFTENPVTFANGDRGTWPPDWLSDNVNPSLKQLNGYPAIQAGLQGVFRGITNTLSSQLTSWEAATNLSARLEVISDVERRMMAAAGNKQATEANQLRDQFLSLTSELSQWLLLNKEKIGEGGLADQQTRMRALLTGGGGGGLDRIVEVCTNALAKKEQPLFTDVLKTVGGFRSKLAETADQLLSDIPADQMKTLDANYLDTANPGGDFSFKVRAAAYHKLVEISKDKTLHPDSKIGTQFNFLGELDKRIKVLADDAARYQGGRAANYKQSYDWFLRNTKDQVINVALNEYLKEAGDIANGLAYPLGTNRQAKALSAADVIQLSQRIQDIRADLRSPAFAATGASSRNEWIDFQSKLERADHLTSALIVGGTTLAQVNVVVDEYSPNQKSDEWRLTYQFIEKFSGRPGWRLDQNQGEPKLLGSMRVDQPVTLKVFDRTESDSPGSGKLKEIKTDGAWGVLELLRLPGSQVDVTNPSVWHVSWPVDLDGLTGALRLRLEFPGGQSPTRKDLGL